MNDISAGYQVHFIIDSETLEPIIRYSSIDKTHHYLLKIFNDKCILTVT